MTIRYCEHNENLRCHCLDKGTPLEILTMRCPNAPPDFEATHDLLASLIKHLLETIERLTDAELDLLIKAPPLMNETNCWCAVYDLASMYQDIAKQISSKRAKPNAEGPIEALLISIMEQDVNATKVIHHIPRKD